MLKVILRVKRREITLDKDKISDFLSLIFTRRKFPPVMLISLMGQKNFMAEKNKN